MDFFRYIHAVGTGPKSNRDLSFEEAKDMMQQMLDQTIPSEQIAAFLLGWRLKPETNEEFLGALHVCDANIIQQEVSNSIELGYPFDGKVNNPYIFPFVADILKKNQHKLQLVIVGDDQQPAKNGITIKDIVSNIDIASNIHYFDRKDFFNKLHKLTTVRNKLGLRTAFNTLEKLPNVAKSEYAVTGVFHKPYVKKYAALFADRYKQLTLIQGNEGTPEIFSKGRLWVVKNGQIQEHKINPEDFGIFYKKSWEKITLKESLEQLQNPSDEYLKLARLNAAVYLFASEKMPTIEDAYDALTE
jgi:anthranilate phosphoribosyltransferase